MPKMRADIIKGMTLRIEFDSYCSPEIGKGLLKKVANLGGDPGKYNLNTGRLVVLPLEVCEEKGGTLRLLTMHHLKDQGPVDVAVEIADLPNPCGRPPWMRITHPLVCERGWRHTRCRLSTVGEHIPMALLRIKDELQLYKMAHAGAVEQLQEVVHPKLVEHLRGMDLVGLQRLYRSTAELRRLHTGAVGATEAEAGATEGAEGG